MRDTLIAVVDYRVGGVPMDEEDRALEELDAEMAALAARRQALLRSRKQGTGVRVVGVGGVLGLAATLEFVE